MSLGVGVDGIGIDDCEYSIVDCRSYDNDDDTNTDTRGGNFANVVKAWVPVVIYPATITTATDIAAKRDIIIVFIFEQKTEAQQFPFFIFLLLVANKFPNNIKITDHCRIGLNN